MRQAHRLQKLNGWHLQVNASIRQLNQFKLNDRRLRGAVRQFKALKHFLAFLGPR
jgi:hypothetical protein